MARPKISSGSYLSHSLIYRISFSRGHRYISGFGYSGMKFSKNFSEHSLKTIPSYTRPARPILCLADAFEHQFSYSDSLLLTGS